MGWSRAWTIARRDLASGFRGLRLLLVCLFLGVGALAAIGSLTSAIQGELNSQGQAILGGDIEIELWQRTLNEEERAFLAQYGTLSPGYRLQAMASTPDAAVPVELKAVDDNYPLYGTLLIEGQGASKAPQSGEAYLAPGAAERLGVATGDSFTLGTEQLQVAGIIEEEPDRLSEGFALGQTVIVSQDLPEQAGLVAPGSMFQSKTRVAFDGAQDPDAVVEELEAAFPDVAFDTRTRNRASPGADRFVSRMGEFLTLIGLAALVIAGIGIGGGVNSYLEARRNSIATLKILGATSGDIARIYALEIGIAALVGAAAGLLVGVLVTPLLAGALGSLLPVTTSFVFDPWALVRAALFGLLVALVFAAPPLVRARQFPAMALMRARVSPLGRQWKAAALPVLLGVGGIVALAIIGSSNAMLSALFLAGAAAILGFLALLGWAIRWASTKLPRPSDPIVRAAIANLHRPGAATGSLVTALGFGLSAFVLLAGVQTSLGGNIQQSVPDRAPDYFVLDIPREGVSDFRSIIGDVSDEAVVTTVPTLRGTVVSFGSEGDQMLVSEMEESDGTWGLRGERGLTYSDTIPDGNVVTSGEWWADGHSGENFVSVDEELATAAGIAIGDLITVNVLGVEFTARVANTRRIDWESLGFNNVWVFSANTFETAPHNLAATIELPEGSETGGLLRTLVQAFPSASVIEVGPILTEARTILDQMSLAILAAASVTVLAGIAVLLGAIAAARAARIYDTVILRVLGASRRQLLALQFAEFGLLAAILAGVALALGSGIAWLIVTQMFEFDWLPDWPQILAVLGGGLVLVLAFALGASLPLLRARPAQTLRSL
ncbi:ABC transporter permease [Aurantiacibacter gangjinensis]|uniref:ABC transporter permease n=1 Tax=Aurantiacibacter gangjinensis TaxID=502682 RepID=A0A0G9MRQ3_9SPHN|nr:FtsX-like permease family protein [Aurantiacibacter gangjinensis]APE26961.1 ABC transporter, permease protein, putative [Aurantiacibacter gangjinensis]KLE33412.1 ABC transporter permease [Aurantiacibacter gangjinensis]